MLWAVMCLNLEGPSSAAEQNVEGIHAQQWPVWYCRATHWQLGRPWGCCSGIRIAVVVQAKHGCKAKHKQPALLWRSYSMRNTLLHVSASLTLTERGFSAVYSKVAFGHSLVPPGRLVCRRVIDSIFTCKGQHLASSLDIAC